MLHLWPFKSILSAVFAVLAIIVVILTANANPQGTDLVSFTWQLVKWSGGFVSLLVILIVGSWRWIPYLQRLIFPYLGGRWVGKIEFDGSSGAETRDVTLHIRHTPFSITLILESGESLSKTLAVQASRSNDIDDDNKLY